MRFHLTNAPLFRGITPEEIRQLLAETIEEEKNHE